MYDDDDLVEDEKCARCKHRVATVFDDDIPVPLCDQCAMWVRTNPNVCGQCFTREAKVMEKWPVPVCYQCDMGLEALGEDLRQMEDLDPNLKMKREDVDEALRRLIAEERQR